jgi:hypothetical protein
LCLNSNFKIGVSQLGHGAGAFSPQYAKTDFRYSKCVDDKHSGPPFRSGGPLSISRELKTYRFSAPYHGLYQTTLEQGYTGRFFEPAYAPAVVPTASDVSGWGAKGWNRSIPVRPVTNVFNFVYEMKDIHDMVTKTMEGFRSAGKDLIRDPGGHYLNYQFGWKPFAKDLMDMLNLQRTLAMKLNQLRRDNGKPVRRRLTLNVEEFSQNVLAQSGTFPLLGPTVYSGLAFNDPSFHRRSVDMTYQRNIWFAGRFRYWIPELRDPISPGLRIYALLTGATPTADVVYRSVPWSWLLDWFTSTGAVLQNMTLNAAYHLVADYAYVMAHESFTYRSIANGKYRSGEFTAQAKAIPWTCWCTTHHKYEWKQRIAANPYGFGVTDSSLNAYQWSILTALGLNRLR